MSIPKSSPGCYWATPNLGDTQQCSDTSDREFEVSATKEASFESVEFWWPLAAAVPHDTDVDAFIAPVKDAGVALDDLSFFADDMPAQGRGRVFWIGCESEFLANLDVIAVNGLQGDQCLLRQPPVGRRRSGAGEAGRREPCCSAQEGMGRICGTVLLEPSVGSEDYPLETSADAFFVLDEAHAAALPDIKELADFYQLAVNGESNNDATLTLRLVTAFT